jgi:hypothetical protein
MGWTSTYKPRGEGIIEFLTRDSINCKNEHGEWKLLKGKVIQNVAYMAVERTFPEGSGKQRYVFAAIFKVQMSPKSDYNFSYKDMDESMGPYYFRCPNDILDLLSETDNKGSLEWRSACRKRNDISAKVKVTKDALVVFENPIKFSNGFQAKVFKVADAKRNRVHGRLENGEFSYGLCVISGLRDYIIRGEAKLIAPNMANALSQVQTEPVQSAQAELAL